MGYTGIRTSNEEEFHEFFEYSGRKGGGVYSTSQVPNRVAIVIGEDARGAEVGKRGEVVCTIDDRTFAAEKSERFGRSDGQGNKVSSVLEGWLRHGETFLEKVDVTASISLWDPSSGKLVLARAHDGVPPLFFAEKNDSLLWSNRITPLLKFGVETELDLRALDAYLTLGYVPSPWTFFSEVRKVPAGKYLDWSDDDWTFKRHWEPTPRTRSVDNIETRAAQFKEHLCESLDRLVEGHDQVGVLLSGGVDSSLLLGLLHCELGVEARAFTFEYSDYQGRYNEYDRAHRLTRRYDIPHHRIHYSGEWLKDNLEKAVREYEEPFTYGHHTARLKEVVESGTTLLLNGVTVGTTHISQTANYALRVDSALAKRVAEVGKLLLKTGPLRKLSRLWHAVDVIESPASGLFYRMPFDRMLPDSIRRQLYVEPDRVSSGKEALTSLFDEEVRQSGLHRKADQLSHLQNQFSVPDHFLWWNYRWARAHELKMGTPFLMPEPRRFLQSLRQPLWPPYEESIQKVLIRRTAATVMPDETAYSEKVAQTAPFWVWFRGPLSPLLRKHLSPSKIQEDELFDAETVTHEVERHIDGTGTRPYLVWSLLCFMVWKRTFLESNDF